MKLGRAVFLALLGALLVAFAIGTVLWMRLEHNVHYIGSAIAPDPFDVGDSGASVIGARHHEEQIGQAV